MLVFLLFGCDSIPFLSKDTATATTDTASASGEPPNPLADIDWNADQLVVKISQSDPEFHSLVFGIVEQTDECLNDTVFGCWTGENCDSSTGYVSPDTSINRGPYCHPLNLDGVILSYSESLEAVINGETGNNVVPGSRTAFPAPTENESYEFKVSYYIGNLSNGDCWAWGTKPEIFESQGCKYPLPIGNVHGKGETLYLLQ